MGDNKLEEVLNLQKMLADMSEYEKRQAMEDLGVLQGKTTKMISRIEGTSKSLRRAADHLDKVWKDCKIARACGAGAGILGGILTISGGVATLVTGGLAGPLLALGMGIGAGGAITSLGQLFVEAAAKSKEIKKAEQDLKETLNHIREVKGWLLCKEQPKLLYMLCLAMVTLEFSHPVVKLLQEVIVRCLHISVEVVEEVLRITFELGNSWLKGAGGVAAQASKQAADDFVGAGAKAGAKAGVRLGAKVIIGVSAAFLVWDIIDLGFTIRDLVEDNGSDVSRILREKADELDKRVYKQ